MDKDTCEEMEFRISLNRKFIETWDPNAAIPKRKAWSYFLLSGKHFDSGFINLLLGKEALAIINFKDSLAIANTAIGHAAEIELNHYAAMFSSFLKLHCEDDACQYAEIIQKIPFTPMSNACAATAEFYIALARLWEGKDITDLVENIAKIEGKRKWMHLYEGTGSALTAIQDRDIQGLLKAMELILDKHMHCVRYFKIPLTQGELMDELSTLICIVALKNGLDVKPLITNSRQLVKTRTISPADRPELPTTKRFKVQTDFIPNYFIAPWCDSEKSLCN